MEVLQLLSHLVIHHYFIAGDPNSIPTIWERSMPPTSLSTSFVVFSFIVSSLNPVSKGCESVVYSI